MNRTSGVLIEKQVHDSAVIDVLTIGGEGTVFRPVQRALRGSGWVIRHAASTQAAVALIESTNTVVAVLESDDTWAETVRRLRQLRNAPAMIVIAPDELHVGTVLEAGAHDLLRRPLDSADLLWGIATAWHIRMSQFEALREYG